MKKKKIRERTCHSVRSFYLAIEWEIVTNL
nr:MAG TPA: hypothetical protein [Caudoviricetes sp.]DAI37671.1 MAG TPA: hypothetical protein [Bacteriophage sp.]DAX12793.1 MAG TPA: hypothetical protein [Bacteriophage sp.]